MKMALPSQRFQAWEWEFPQANELSKVTRLEFKLMIEAKLKLSANWQECSAHTNAETIPSTHPNSEFFCWGQGKNSILADINYVLVFLLNGKSSEWGGNPGNKMNYEYVFKHWMIRCKVQKC